MHDWSAADGRNRRVCTAGAPLRTGFAGVHGGRAVADGIRGCARRARRCGRDSRVCTACAPRADGIRGYAPAGRASLAKGRSFRSLCAMACVSAPNPDLNPGERRSQKGSLLFSRKCQSGIHAAKLPSYQVRTATASHSRFILCRRCRLAGYHPADASR